MIEKVFDSSDKKAVLWHPAGKFKYYFILLCHIPHRSIHTLFHNKTLLLSSAHSQEFIINVRLKEPNVSKV